jgi:phosphate transport system permease protein
VSVGDILAPGEEPLVNLRSPRTTADWIFRALLFVCASTVLIIIAGIVFYLLRQTGPAWRHQGIQLFTSDAWNPAGKAFGLLGDLVGSAIIGLIALVVAVPIAIAIALAINEYLPRVLRRPLTTLVDLLAALPSLVFGLWGKYFLDHEVRGTTKWLAKHGAAFPLFRVQGTQIGGSLFLAGMIVAIMVLPLITAVSREVMSQVPREDCEAALALGGTRWGMVTDVVLPFSRNGIVGAAMLGLGRALGEAVAVSIVLLSNEHLTSHILQPRGGSISALIVREFLSGSDLERSALTVAGLALFAVTLAVNVGARMIVLRSRAGPRR